MCYFNVQKQEEIALQSTGSSTSPKRFGFYLNHLEAVSDSAAGLTLLEHLISRSPSTPLALPSSPFFKGCFFRSTQTMQSSKAATNYTISKTKSTRIMASNCYVEGKLCFTISSLLVVVSKST